MSENEQNIAQKREDNKENIIAAVPNQASVTHIDAKRVIQWVTLTRNAESPKLDYIKGHLSELGIPYQEYGFGLLGPILQVPVDKLALASEMVLGKQVGQITDGAIRVSICVDDLEDDHVLFRRWYMAQCTKMGLTKDDMPAAVRWSQSERDEAAAWDEVGQQSEPEQSAPGGEYVGLDVEAIVLPSSIEGMAFNINIVSVDSSRATGVGILRKTDVGMDDLEEDIYFIRFKGPTYYLYQAHAETPWAIGTWEGLLAEQRAKQSGDMTASVGKYIGTHIINKHECGQATCKKLTKEGQWEVVLRRVEKPARAKKETTSAENTAK